MFRARIISNPISKNAQDVINYLYGRHLFVALKSSDDFRVIHYYHNHAWESRQHCEISSPSFYGHILPGTCFTFNLCSHNWNCVKNSMCSYLDSVVSIRSQFCTCHDSSSVMACAKLWPDLVIIFHIRATHILIRFRLGAHKLFVKWIPVLLTMCLI